MIDLGKLFSKTEKLRELLDALGVEWEQGPAYNITDINGKWRVFESHLTGLFSITTTAFAFTVIDVVAATIGFVTAREAALNKVALEMWSEMDTSRLCGEPIDSDMADKFAETLRDLGMKVE